MIAEERARLHADMEMIRVKRISVPVRPTPKAGQGHR